MANWTSDELNKIGNAEELQIAGLRPDGTLPKFVIIWVVRVGEALYIRSYKGRTSGWYKGVQTRLEGMISAGGVEKEVTFVEVTDKQENDLIDAEYRVKYRSYPQYIDPMISPEVRETTIKLVPR
jgi:hypothetical protein